MADNKKGDLISRSRLLRDIYFQEGRYPESHLLRMAINEQPAVDAVKVNGIKFDYMMIDESGVPEMKLLIGDRSLILRTDPVDVKKVVHGHWGQYEIFPGAASLNGYPCSICGERVSATMYHLNYCPNCGAKMDGKKLEKEVAKSGK